MWDNSSFYAYVLQQGACPVIVAEVGVNHDGRLEQALELIKQAKQCGADAVKFQTYSTDRLVTQDSPKAPYQIRNTGSAQSQYAMLKQLEIPEWWYSELLGLSHELGLLFISTPYDVYDVTLLEKMGVDAMKVPSAWAVEPEYLTAVSQAGKPVLLSTGMCTFEEVAFAVDLVSRHNQHLVILQCTTNYPTAPEDCNIAVLKTFADVFGFPVGLSDHSRSHIPSILAVGLGARLIERHFTLDKNLPGPDHSSSDAPDDFAALVKELHAAVCMMGRPQKRPVPAERENLNSMRRSAVAIKPIEAGTKITPEALQLKRPLGGIEPRHVACVLGEKALVDISPGEQITSSMVNIAAEFALKLVEISTESLPGLLKIFDSIRSDEGSDLFHPHAFTAEYARLLCNYSGKDYYCLAMFGDEIAGYAMLRGWDEGYTRPTVGIYVMPVWRKKGLAPRILRMLEPEARQRGATEIMAKVYRQNVSSLKAFATAGYFRVTEKDGTVFLNAFIA